MTEDSAGAPMRRLAAGERVAVDWAGLRTLLGGPVHLLAAPGGGAPRFVATLPVGSLVPGGAAGEIRLWIRPVRDALLSMQAGEAAAARTLAALAEAADCVDDGRRGTEDAEGFAARAQDLLATILARPDAPDPAALGRRVLDRARVRDARFAETLHGFGRLLEGRFQRPPDSIVPTQLALAAGTLTAALRVKVVPVPQQPGEAAADYLNRFAAANQLRLRRIRMDRDSLPDGEAGLIAFEEGEPRVLLAHWRGGYRLTAPDGDTASRLLSRSGWAALEPDLFAFYPTLPSGRLTYRTILGFGLWAARVEMGLVGLCGIVGSLLSLLPPITASLIANVGVFANDLPFVGQLVAVLLAALLAETAFFAIGQLAELRLQGRAALLLHAAMVDRLLRLPARALRDSTHLILATQMETVAKLRSSLLAVATHGALALASGLAAALLVAWSNAAAGLAAVAMVLTLLAAAAFLGLAQFKAIYEGERMDVVVLAFAYDLIRLVPILRAQRAESAAFVQWGQNFLAFQTRLMRSARFANRFRVLEEGWDVAAIALGFLVIATSGATGSLDAGAAIVFVLALVRFLRAGKAAAHALLDGMRLLPMAKLSRPFIEHELEATASGEAPPHLSGRIEVSGLSFGYRGKAVLNNLSLSIDEGEFVGLVGPSGSGKSTLLRLLLGLERPGSGTILIDGYDLASLDRRQVARQIGVVPQNGRLFPGSLYENIRGVNDLDLDEAWHLAELAGIADEIRALPMGLRTIVGEGDGGLARGQVQRILMARALAQRPRVLVLDEATSALDGRSQARIVETLDRLPITRILVAHRPAALMTADRIHVLEGGRIVRSGKPADILLSQSHTAAA